MSYNFFGGYKAKKFDVTENFYRNGVEILGALDSPGTKAHQTLSVSGVVADAQTVTIGASAGADIYEIDQINTDTTKNTTAALTATDTTVLIATGHGLESGDLIVIGTECMYVSAAAATSLTVIRGWGSANTVHLTNQDVYKSAAGYTATRIPVPIVRTGTTAEAFIDNFVAVMAKAKDAGSVKNTGFTAVKASAALVVLLADEVGASTLATTESGTNLDWSGATVVNGSAAKVRKMVAYNHTVTAADASLTTIYIPVDSEPEYMIAEVRNSDGANQLWNGQLAFTLYDEYDDSPAGVISANNAGATNWSATDTLTVIAFY